MSQSVSFNISVTLHHLLCEDRSLLQAIPPITLWIGVSISLTVPHTLANFFFFIHGELVSSQTPLLNFPTIQLLKHFLPLIQNELQI